METLGAINDLTWLTKEVDFVLKKFVKIKINFIPWFHRRQAKI